MQLNMKTNITYNIYHNRSLALGRSIITQIQASELAGKFCGFNY